MKFSDTIIPWKNQNAGKSLNKLDANYAGEIPKMQKDLYLQTAIRNPDFNQTISEVYERVLQHSTHKEQVAMEEILKKVDAGELEFEDLSTIETLSTNNYKYLFHNSPESNTRNAIPTAILISLITVALIVLRIVYVVENSSSLLFIISIINLTACAYTFLNWPLEVTYTVGQWLQSNNIKQITHKKITAEVSKKLWFLSSFLLILLIVWLLFSHFVLSRYELGSDVVSIVALGVSILNSTIIQSLAVFFEKHIYYDN